MIKVFYFFVFVFAQDIIGHEIHQDHLSAFIGEIYCQDSLFLQCFHPNSNGGAIHSEVPTFIIGCTFKWCSGINGGSVFLAAQFIIRDSCFSRGAAKSGGFIAYSVSEECILVISRTSFIISSSEFDSVISSGKSFLIPISIDNMNCSRLSCTNTGSISIESKEINISFLEFSQSTATNIGSITVGSQGFVRIFWANFHHISCLAPFYICPPCVMNHCTFQSFFLHSQHKFSAFFRAKIELISCISDFQMPNSANVVLQNHTITNIQHESVTCCNILNSCTVPTKKEKSTFLGIILSFTIGISLPVFLYYINGYVNTRTYPNKRDQ